MQTPDHTITKVESTACDVKITLANGVVLHISSNPNYLHCHFSGAKDLVATPFAHQPQLELNRLPLANYVDLEYKKTREW